MKKWLFLCFAACVLSCTKETVPGDLPASLQTMVAQADCTCEPYIQLYRWNGRLVYVKGFAGATCNWVASYYDEQGQPLQIDQSFDLFLRQAGPVLKEWRCGK